MSSAGTRRTGPGQALTPKSASLFMFLNFARMPGLAANWRAASARSAASRRQPPIRRAQLAAVRLLLPTGGRPTAEQVPA